MELATLNSQLEKILVQYEEGERGPQRAMEVIAAQFNDFCAGLEALPTEVSQLKRAIDAWEKEERSDVDVLATLSALSRHYRSLT